MKAPPGMKAWTVEGSEDGTALASFVRNRAHVAWSEAKGWIASGKVFVDGVVETREGRRLEKGTKVELRMAAPRRTVAPPAFEVKLVWEDAHLVVIDKPSGVSSVP